MKKAAKSFFIILIAFFYSNLCLSQSGKYSVERAISLNKDSETNIVEIEVQEKTEFLHLNIVSTIESGSLTIAIYNPKKEKQGDLSIGSMITIGGSKTKNKNTSEIKKRNEDVIGRIDKRFEKPMRGTWTIKFIAKEAVCEIHLRTNYLF